MKLGTTEIGAVDRSQSHHSDDGIIAYLKTINKYIDNGDLLV
ncbi:hypothetical protein [Chamaesiphon sp. VAR_48_metabat_403]|nr:hypothetical protein [Chamaesiphon sp. VAR_48_metabat_403]